MRNRAYTLDRLARGAKLRTSLVEAVRLGLPWQQKSLTALAWRRDGQSAGIAAARPRSGPQSWEITHLLLASDEDAECADLLDELCWVAVRKGGERVIVRLQEGDPITDVARRCGFVPSTREVLYVGRHGTRPSRRSLPVREKRAEDDYNLFRLYTACTPVETRAALAMTFGQWSSSRERSRGRSRELVLDRNGQLKGWVKAVRRFGVGQLAMMVHPDEEVSLSGLLDHGLSHLTGAVYCLVPEYQALLGRLLEQKGYRANSDYVTLVRSMAARLKKAEGRQAVNVASI